MHKSPLSGEDILGVGTAVGDQEKHSGGLVVRRFGVGKIIGSVAAPCRPLPCGKPGRGRTAGQGLPEFDLVSVRLETIDVRHCAITRGGPKPIIFSGCQIHIIIQDISFFIFSHVPIVKSWPVVLFRITIDQEIVVGIQGLVHIFQRLYAAALIVRIIVFSPCTRPHRGNSPFPGSLRRRRRSAATCSSG